ncbi:MAG: helix-hairpin-helix domain-containing protein [Clostridiales bacterium]|nr:helix-hairpin-helix domain-containing protein [Clostridiales bacterium]
MKEKRDEAILVAMALLAASFLIVYNAFSAPSEYIKSTKQSFETVTTSKKNTEPTKADPVKNDIKSDPVNINTADVEAFERIEGIGPEKAKAIVEYREENGDFKSVDELLECPGIGEKTLERIRPFLTLQ